MKKIRTIRIWEVVLKEILCPKKYTNDFKTYSRDHVKATNISTVRVRASNASEAAKLAVNRHGRNFLMATSVELIAEA